MEARALPIEIPAAADQRVLLHNMRWADYEILLAIRGEKAVPRLTYLKGTIEIMSPSLDHERIKTKIGRMLESWALLNDVALEGAGSWTLRSAPGERGLEPDECYFVGPARTDRPDLAIEVNLTSGGLDKLEVYRGLGVPEVWIWEAGAIHVWGLVDGAYARRDASELLPGVDLAKLAACALIQDQTEAVRRFLRS